MSSLKGRDEYNYELAAASHGEATLIGDHQTANQSYSNIVKCLLNLRKHEDEGDASLLRLAHNKNPSIACWASTHLLATNESKAIDRLEQLATDEAGIIGFGAEMVLQEWRADRLKLP